MFPAPPSRQRRSFTLIELLLTIGIIAILSAVVLVAVNPRRQLGGAQEAERRSQAREVEKAMFQYLIDYRRLPGDRAIPEGGASPLPICRPSLADPGCVNLDVLIPTYIACLPIDGAETNPLYSGYETYHISGRPRVQSVYLGSGAVASGRCSRPPTPVAHWRFDETTLGNTAIDASGHGHSAIPVGFTTPFGPSTEIPTVHFPNVRSLEFDGMDDHLIVATTPRLDINRVFTLTAWIYLRAAPTQDRDFLMRSDGTGQNELALTVEDTGVLALHIDGTRYETSTTLPIGRWVHVAAIRDNATATLYMDGIVEGTGNPGSQNTIYNTCATLHIGTDVDPGGNGCTDNLTDHWDGYLDDIRIYDLALTAAQIASLASGNP
jgi:prepilin-type N-terminal cleavage/methylation domain-containing protein